ncbi:hypothetical protein KJZ99_10810 [bacterium]|nr:hypothetical protein [bacterium]
MAKTLTYWNVEDDAFWQGEGRRTAYRNLWISIPCLLCGFAVWMYWSIVTTKMQELGFQFDPDPAKNKAMLYTLISIAGLTGATLRIPNSFFVALSGGRNVIAATTALLILPALGLGLALREPGTSYSTFVILSALSGIGGGAFASSMSNISLFFPKRIQGTALGLNAGLGNLGVSVMQVLLPFVMTFGMFGAAGGEAWKTAVAAGAQPVGTLVWIQNSGFVWVPILGVLTILAWVLMNNLAVHNVGSTPAAISKMLYLSLLGYAGAALGLYLLVALKVNMWIVLPITIIVTLILIRYLSPAKIRQNLSNQFAIFKVKHNWVMTWLYVMTFGSFIGYSAAFPKLIQDVFGFLPDGSANPNAPNPFAYAWLGPLVGSLIRPVGGWLSDKFGGARVTHWDTILMILAALGVAYNIEAASNSPTPEAYFVPFLLLFLLLFITTGIGNGSTFRMIPIIFDAKHAGPVLGWTSAIAAYGAFIIPKVFGTQIQAGHPEYALYGFALYYVSCLAVNWWFYARKGAEIKC